jgi:predicted transcriptional regulator
MSKAGKAPLSDLENKIMRVVWWQGQATAETVRAALGAAPSLKDSTVRTILRRLEQKGYVSHQSAGRAYVYSPTVAPRNVAVDAVRKIIQRFCNGSVEDLLLGMVDGEVVSTEALQELAARIATSEKAGETAKPRPAKTTRRRS